jgi:hypothetical protein
MFWMICCFVVVVVCGGCCIGLRTCSSLCCWMMCRFVVVMVYSDSSVVDVVTVTGYR